MLFTFDNTRMYEYLGHRKIYTKLQIKKDTTQNMRECRFSLTHIFPILSFYGNIRVRENPYSRIFFAVTN